MRPKRKVIETTLPLLMAPEVIFIASLLAANGLFALAEIAIVSARRGHLRKLATKGNAKAAAALVLAESPSRFLSAMQIGINLVGATIGVYGGATLVSRLSVRLAPVLDDLAEPVALVLVVISITVLTVLFGEMIPKRVAQSNPERYALFVARPMRLLTALGTPLVWLIATVTEAVVKVLSLGRISKQKVSDEEIAQLIEQGQREGVFHAAEKRMVAGVLALDQLPVTAIMNPRPKIVWLNVEDPDEVNWRKIVTSGHSHFPVYRADIDNVLGMISVKALWANSAAGFRTPMKDLITQPLRIPETTSCIQLLELFKRSGRHIGLVTDEFGATEGIVTLIDVLEAIVGDLPSRGQAPGPSVVQRADGSWLIDATLPINDLKETLRLAVLPGEDTADFQTLGGLVLTHLGRIPKAGDFFDGGAFRWEVVDMDHFRIDKVLVSPLVPASPEAQAGESGSAAS